MVPRPVTTFTIHCSASLLTCHSTPIQKPIMNITTNNSPTIRANITSPIAFTTFQTAALAQLIATARTLLFFKATAKTVYAHAEISVFIHHLPSTNIRNTCNPILYWVRPSSYHSIDTRSLSGSMTFEVKFDQFLCGVFFHYLLS